MHIEKGCDLRQCKLVALLAGADVLPLLLELAGSAKVEVLDSGSDWSH